ncbi:MAG: DegV family protein [Anaerolineae bacterium]|nr:DegV family protein [Anaerolineae bacterium]
MCAQKIAVVTDSTTYIPQDVVQRFDLSVIPLNVIWGDEGFKDGVEIDPTTFYQRLQSSKTMPTTSQPSAGEFVDFFRQVAEAKNVDTVVGIFISSDLSGTIASAVAAKSLLPDLRIEVVDSRSTSMGEGFQALAAAGAAQAGASLNEVLEAAQQVRYRQRILFLVDTLEFLHRGGRIGGAKRLLGTAFKIKPILELDGTIDAVEQVRTRKKAKARLMEMIQERRGTAQIAQAAVVHAAALEEAHEMKQELIEMLNIEDAYIAEVSPVIGSHVGPGTVGVAFYTH